MELISSEIKECLTHSSAIRKMFEAGMELKQKYGAENVFDYSLGNPDLPPPAKVGKSLERIAAETRQPFSLGYMSNAGYPAVRAKLAELLTAEQGVPLKGDHIVITCGAAGGINVFFRAVLTRGDEVLTPCPYFVEYGFYVGNSGGKLVPVPSVDFTFEPDADRLAAAIRAFHPGAHRLQEVAAARGVRYVNDSKATNPAAVMAARMVSMSRISPSWITSGLWRRQARRAVGKVAVSMVISRWLTMLFWSRWRYSMGSSRVMM